MDRQGVICAGNWIVDIVHEIDHWPNKNDLATISREEHGVGGGAANVVTALARFMTGLPLTPVGAIGEDALSEIILESCRALDLPTDHLIRYTDAPTAHTHVMSVPGESRTFFYQGGANDKLSANDFKQDFFKNSNARIFYLGYLMLLAAMDRIVDGTTEAAQVLGQAKASGMTTCVDLVSAERADFADVVAASARHIDYFIMNEVEACRASRMPLEAGQTPSDDKLLEAAQRLFELGVGKAVIIHCPEKALWLGRGEDPVLVRPERLSPDEIVSPVGAGDAFCAGILYGIHAELPVKSILTLAHNAAKASMAGITATESIPPLDQLMPS